MDQSSKSLSLALSHSKESFKCDNNHQTVNRKEVKGGASSMTTVMCCHEDMCNHEGTDGRRVSAVATKSLLQLQQRIKLNQQRDVAMAPSSSSSGSVASTAALTGLKNGGTAGASASPAAAAVQSGECVVKNKNGGAGGYYFIIIKIMNHQTTNRGEWEGGGTATTMKSMLMRERYLLNR